MFPLEDKHRLLAANLVPFRTAISENIVGAGKRHDKADEGKIITVMLKKAFAFKMVLRHQPDSEMQYKYACV